MSIEGYFAPIPGLVILMPSTSFRCVRSVEDRSRIWRPGVGSGAKVDVPADAWVRHFPGEPTDADSISKLRKGLMRGEIPEIQADVRVPFSKAAIRREGSDVTIVSWGRAATPAWMPRNSWRKRRSMRKSSI